MWPKECKVASLHEADQKLTTDSHRLCTQIISGPLSLIFCSVTHFVCKVYSPHWQDPPPRKGWIMPLGRWFFFSTGNTHPRNKATTPDFGRQLILVAEVQWSWKRSCISDSASPGSMPDSFSTFSSFWQIHPDLVVLVWLKPQTWTRRTVNEKMTALVIQMLKFVQK